MFTEQQLSIIAKYPLDAALQFFRSTLIGGGVVLSQDVVQSLLGILEVSSACQRLSAITEPPRLCERLYSLRDEVRRGVHPHQHLFGKLLDSSMDGSDDIAIWQCVFDLIHPSALQTPPPADRPPVFAATPIRVNSSQVDDSKDRKILEAELFKELDGRVYIGVNGFCDKFFLKNKAWTPLMDTLYRSLLTAHGGKRWETFPISISEDSVREWLLSLQRDHLTGDFRKFRHTGGPHDLAGRKAQLDFFILKKDSHINDSNEPCYKDILVVGEFKKKYLKARFKQDFLQLARYIRSVLADEPLRLFVHGFLFCEDMIEFWVMDRAGCYSSGSINIHKHPELFAQAIVAYVAMDEMDLGLNSHIVFNENSGGVLLTDASGARANLFLDESLFRQYAIACRGTVCFGTREGNVVKFSWASDRRTTEVSHLQTALRHGIKGVVRLIARYKLTSIDDLRAGLTFPDPHRFRSNMELQAARAETTESFTSSSDSSLF